MILVLVGVKMALGDVYHLPIMFSLAVVVGVIGAAVVPSLLRPEPLPEHDPLLQPQPTRSAGTHRSPGASQPWRARTKGGLRSAGRAAATTVRRLGARTIVERDRVLMISVG